MEKAKKANAKNKTDHSLSKEQFKLFRKVNMNNKANTKHANLEKMQLKFNREKACKIIVQE